MAGSRRNFFTAFLGQLKVLADEARGVQHIPLDNLHTLPEEMIGEIIPVLFNDGTWRIENKRLLKLDGKAGEYSLYRQLNVREAAIITQFGTGKSLEEISRSVSRVCEIGIEETRRATFNVFFRCARLRICHPAEPVSLEDRTQAR